MATENENLKNNNQQLTIQLNAYKDKEDVKAAQDKEMFKIFIEGFKERQEININKNLTINNIKPTQDKNIKRNLHQNLEIIIQMNILSLKMYYTTMMSSQLWIIELHQQLWTVMIRRHPMIETQMLTLF